MLKVKRICFKIVLLLLILISTNALGTGPAVTGQPVTDFGAYAYFVDMLKEQYKTFELLRNQYIEMSTHYQRWLDNVKTLKTNYYRVQDTITLIDNFQRTLLNNPTALGDQWFGKELQKLGGDIESLTKDTYKFDPNVDFKKLVQDIEEIELKLTPSERSKYITHKNRIKSVVNEQKFQKAISTTNEILTVQKLDGSAGFQARKTATLHNLATAAAGAENLKDSSEISNALLCQILDTLNTTLFMQALTFNASISVLTGSRSQEDLDAEIQNAQNGIRKVLKAAYLRKGTSQ